MLGGENMQETFDQGPTHFYTYIKYLGNAGQITPKVREVL